jgi:hypothetical protein
MTPRWKTTMLKIAEPAKQTVRHTPGPWTVRDYETKDGGIWIDGGFVRNRSCGTVALAYPVTAQHANASLIAAAPDLLAALQALVIESGGRAIPNSSLTAARDQAIAAIALATDAT